VDTVGGEASTAAANDDVEGAAGVVDVDVDGAEGDGGPFMWAVHQH